MGRRYALRVRVRRDAVDVYLDGRLQIEARTKVDVKGGFAIKAWGSTVRFSRIAVWRPETAFDWIVSDDDFIDRPRAPSGPCDGSTRGDPGRHGELSVDESRACSPIFAQRTGFCDCNNVNGEATSHGAFLAGLVEVWRRRRTQLSSQDQNTLKRSIVATMACLEQLFRLGGFTGRYKHEDLGRACGNDLDANDNFLTYFTLAAVYGDLSFAANGQDAAPELAFGAMKRGWLGCLWLVDHHLAATHRTLLYSLVYRCAHRDRAFADFVTNTLPVALVSPILTYLKSEAVAAGDAFFTTESHFMTLDGWKKSWRDTGQMIPWFEGVHLARELFPTETKHWCKYLDKLTGELVADLTARNAFHVVPQASGGDEQQNVNELNWNNMASVPAVIGPGIIPGRHFYNCTFFSTMALDMVLLGQLTGRRELERLAAGHLGWVLGLNAGVPGSKAQNPSPSGSGWKATAFIQGLDAPHVLGFEEIDHASKQKPWRWNGEGRYGDDLPLEVWRFQPLREWNGFMSIVNGHVLWEGQWDYFNVGHDGWISAETFMLNDGIFARAAVTYEDWAAGVFAGWVTLSVGDILTASAMQNQDGRLEIVASRPNGTMLHTWETSPGGLLAEWHSMDGFVERPFGLLNLDGRLELFGRGADGALWHRWQVNANGPFAAWHSLADRIVNATATRNADDRIEIFAAFSDGSIQHRWQRAPNEGFDAWFPLGSGHGPVVNRNADGRLELFVIGNDRAVHHCWQVAPNQHFDRWHSLEGTVVQLTVASNQDGRMELFAITSDLQVVHRWQVAPNGRFDAWHSLGGNYTSVQSVQLGDGRIELFAIDTDLAVWRKVQASPNGQFMGWECLGSFTTSLFATVDGAGRAVLLARQGSGALWFARQPAIGSWLVPI